MKGARPGPLLAWVGALAFLVSGPGWGQERPQPEAATGRGDISQAQGRQHMVVTANPHASRAALEILRQGGSAVDAAIAAQMVLNLVEPQSSGIGGGAFLVVYQAQTGRTLAYSGREAAPATAGPDLFLDSQGQPQDFRAMVASGRGVGVPGLLRVLERAHQAHGRLPWRALFQRAIELAESGFPVSPRLHQLLVRDEALRRDPGARRYFYLPDGQALPVGFVLRNPDLAATLRRVAEEGVEAFYQGSLAEAMVAAVGAHPRPGTLTVADLAGYQAQSGEALCRPYRHVGVCTVPPPGGGTTVLQILGLLERFDLAQVRPGSAFFAHLFSEAGRLAYADRERYLADPAAVPVPVEGLLARTYLAQRGAGIGLAGSRGPALPGLPAGVFPGGVAPGQSLEQPSTSHMSIVDRQGNGVAMTSSIEDAFGSRILVAGFLLNNQLTDFSFTPGVANAPGPGKRPRSAMAPAVVVDAGGGLVGLLGSPGGSRIPNYLAQTLVGLVDWGQSPAQAVAQPRVGSRNGATELEAGTSAEAAGPLLSALGHPVAVVDTTSGVHLVWRGGPGWLGAADPRREGLALGE